MTEPVPGSAGPLDIAMDAERADPAPDSPARRVLTEQAELIRAQRRTEALVQFDHRAGAALKLLTVAVGLTFAVALGAMAWSASRDRSLVITALDAPPDLVARGLTGQVLSGQLLDKIAAIDARAQSFRAPETFRNDWGGDIQVEIPQTGVSIGEIDRYLRQWLGKRTSIGGEVFREPAGLALTVRTGAGGSVTVRGADAELDVMLQQAAEGVFERTQPFRYSKYLEFSGRSEQAMEVAQRLAAEGPAAERPWAWAQISNLQGAAGDFEGAAAPARRAVTLDPENGLGWLNRGIAEFILGREEASLQSVRRSIALLRNGRGGVSDLAVSVGKLNEATFPDFVRDHATSLKLLRTSPEITYAGLPLELPVQEAIQLIRLHEASAARRLVGARVDGTDVAEIGNEGDLLSPQYLLAEEAGDWAAAVAVLKRAVGLSQTAEMTGAVARERILWPRLAHAYAMVGRTAEARELLRTVPRDCYRCLILEGRALAQLGDLPGAERTFAEAARQAPSLPTAHAEWGRVRLLHGRAADAVPLLREAQRRGPRWADPLKWEGDALARQGEHGAAVRKYAAATERAPRWGALHLAWGLSLEALGRDRQARSKYAEAARLDLSAADRAAVQRLRGPAA